MQVLAPPFIISIYGKPASGKSHLMRYILCKMRAEKKFDILIVFTGLIQNGFFDNMVDSRFVMRYNEKLLTQYWKRAQAIVHKKKNILFVFDDCIGLVNWTSPMVDKVFTTHQHSNVLILVSTQYPNKLPTLIREVSSMACIFKQSTKWSRKAVYDSYGEDYGSLKDFIKYMNSLPDYCFICVNNSNSGKDKYWKTKAPATVPKFYYQNMI